MACGASLAYKMRVIATMDQANGNGHDIKNKHTNNPQHHASILIFITNQNNVQNIGFEREKNKKQILNVIISLNECMYWM